MRSELALFCGAGGSSLAGKLLGLTTVCGVEIDAYARSVLLQRQRQGQLPVFPIWSDIRSFDGRPWRGKIFCTSGGFPCTDISISGRGAGITGAKSSLWSEMARVIGEVKSPYCFVENSPMLTSRGLDVVLRDLACMGYDARWGVLSAQEACGAPHQRKRIWILGKMAHTNS